MAYFVNTIDGTYYTNVEEGTERGTSSRALESEWGRRDDGHNRRQRQRQGEGVARRGRKGWYVGLTCVVWALCGHCGGGGKWTGGVCREEKRAGNEMGKEWYGCVCTCRSGRARV